MKTVHEICTEALLRTKGATPPATIESTTDILQRQLKSLLHGVAYELRNTRSFPQQKRQHTITLESGRVRYPLPEDFYSPLPGTHWDQTNDWRLDGPMSDGDFTLRLHGALSTETQRAFRPFGPDFNPTTEGGQFYIDPSPSSTDTLSFEYITRTVFLPPHWYEGEALTGTGHYRNANGNIYISTTSATTGANPPSGTGTNIGDGGVIWNYVSAPYETIRLDEDLCVFDDDLMIVGLQSRYMLANGQENSLIEEMFERMIDNSVSRWKGSYFTSLGAAPGRWPNLPEGGYG